MIFRSALPEIEVPSTSLPAFVLEHAAAFGDKPALIDGTSGRTITYTQLIGMTRALAAGLALRGFGPGDVFAIFSPNVPEYAVAFHGVLAAGGANTTINSLASTKDIETQLRSTRARFLLTTAIPGAGHASRTGRRRRGGLRARRGCGNRVGALVAVCDRSGAGLDRPRPHRVDCSAAHVERHYGLREGRATDPSEPGRERPAVRRGDRDPP